MASLVSVIIPAYNEEKVIADCLSSLAKQSYNPLEIIVVDDGSIDKTQEIVSNFKFQVRGHFAKTIKVLDRLGTLEQSTQKVTYLSSLTQT